MGRSKIVRNCRKRLFFNSYRFSSRFAVLHLANFDQIHEIERNKRVISNFTSDRSEEQVMNDDKFYVFFTASARGALMKRRRTFR